VPKSLDEVTPRRNGDVSETSCRDEWYSDGGVLLMMTCWFCRAAYILIEDVHTLSLTSLSVVIGCVLVQQQR